MAEMVETSVSEMLADYFAALSHPTRIEILKLFRENAELCTCDIMKKLKKCQSNISRHLAPLRRIGIVDSRSEGVRTFYRVKDRDVYKILDIVADILYKHTNERHKILRGFKS